MKSPLQMRAENAFARFRSARRPIVIEFAGIPKAGKTSTITALHAFLKRCGFRVEIVVERASVCPIRDKKHANFNIWTACTTLAQILEKTQNPPRYDDPHILILDRGMFDAICWLILMEHLERIRSEDRLLTEKFLRISDWRKRISGVIVMTVAPADAMKREKGLLPVEDGIGSIMNPEVLQQMLDTTHATVERLKNDFQIFTIDTSSGEAKDNPKYTAEIVADLVLNIIEEHLQEDILSVLRFETDSIFKGLVSIGADDAGRVVRTFLTKGDFRPRDQVESDSDRVQALPVVVVRNKTGDVLRLRRREKAQDNPLHEKIVIWAGGHVRKEDQANGESMLCCALRELQEELRLCLEPTELKLIGAVYCDVSKRTSKHVAVVYEWRAHTDDVAVVLSTAEFFERQGTSLSGKFVPLKSLVEDVETGKIIEPWSVEIIRKLLAKGDHALSPLLL